MVVLKTKSQLKNFVKRMKDKYQYQVSMDCGCCFHGTLILVDEERKRVIKHEYSDGLNSFNSATVLATFKKIR